MTPWFGSAWLKESITGTNTMPMMSFSTSSTASCSSISKTEPSSWIQDRDLSFPSEWSIAPAHPIAQSCSCSRTRAFFPPGIQRSERSAVLIFPVALLGLGDPLHCGGNSFVPRLLAFGLGNPLHVLSFAAWAECREDGRGLFISLQCCLKLGRRIE